MKLQNLKIKGFKSFADKTDVLFDNQITGIVGPNGCGKSNIVDAIRWVIGEHKISNLRSESLDGLVFNGSKTRPASGMAEVSLTFENDNNVLPMDFSTVTISRKFYKNGESEYRLNDVVCRLKDIHNLFLDTGVSSDSYAIIELGMVDEIIKDKDNARRKMIEQAAGVSIYKTRKKEAQSKLKSTEADLNRIEDLLYEIDANVKSLQRQAKKAEKYKVIKEEYRDVSIKHAQKSLTNFNTEFQDLNRTILQLEEEKIKVDKELESKIEGVQQLKNDVESKEQKLNAMQKEYNQMLHVITSLEQDKQLNLQKLHFQQDKVASLDQLIKQTAEQLAEAKSEVGRLENSVLSLDKEYNAQKENQASLQTELEDKKQAFENARSDVESHKATLADKMREKYKTEKDFAVLETSIANIKKSINQEEEETQRRKSIGQELESEKQQKAEELQSLKNQFSDLQERQESLKNKILDQQQELENVRVQLHDANRSLDSKQNEYDLLQSLVDSLEGYPESIKYLSKEKDWSPKPTVLSDIILPQEKYKNSIESVLSPYLNYFVVDNFFEAQKAIELLQENKKGRANFFLLDKITHPKTLSKLSSMTSALEVVEYDSKYEKLLEMLLGNVYINEESGIQEIDLNEDYTIVNIDGNVLLNEYSITGGSSGIFDGNKLGRAKNLEKLKASIEELRSQTNNIENIFAQTQQAIRATQEGLNENKLKELSSEIQSLEQNIYGLDTKQENIHRSDLSSAERIEEFQSQLKEKEDKYNSLVSEDSQKENTLRSLQQELSQYEEVFTQNESSYRQAADRWNVFQVELEAKNSQLKNAQESLNLRKNQIENLETQLENSEKEQEVTRQIIQESSSSDTDFSQHIEKQVHIKTEKQKELDLLDQDFHNLKKELSTEESEINKVRNRREQVSNDLLSNKENMSSMRLQVSTLNERMKLEFDVHLDSILNEEVHVPESEEELQARVDSLRQKMSSMGEINPTAIEAYQEIKQRQDFITEQREDLVQAKENLLQTIQEVEETANQKFKDTFEKVRTNFQEVFAALFTEDDTCDMKMTDPDNPTETGIEIYARPKGKKPSVITQLSGGEKTLTATALLFAIYLIKPAPFCILDEVDAPLDDANVEKFTKMIRQFSDKSQFIIVTHNKQTMAAVDAIYGVTMQEPGVSKLVPVDFRSLN